MNFENALMTAIVTLTGAVGTMALWFKAQFNAVAAKLNECEDDRTELWETLAFHGIRKHKCDRVEVPKASRRPRLRGEEEEG